MIIVKNSFFLFGKDERIDVGWFGLVIVNSAV